MFRPMTSDVSALSGFVANGHQAIHLVSSPPSKIPYGGFSPVRLQTGCQPCPSRLAVTFTPPQWRSPPCAFISVVGLYAKRHSRPLTPHTRPVALGSASGYSVRQPLRLLWPHPSFCPPPPVSFMPAAPRRTEVPQFTPPELDSVPPSLLRWLQDADRRVCAPDLAFAHPVGARQPRVHTPDSRGAC